MVGRNQPGIMHGTGETGGLGIQRHVIKPPHALLVHGQPGILAGMLGRPVQRAYQLLGAARRGAQAYRRIKETDRDAVDHLADVIHLYGPLAQKAPDFRHHMIQDAVEADVLGHEPEMMVEHALDARWPVTRGLITDAEQRLQVEGQHLGQEVFRLFGGKPRMEPAAIGHGQHAQFTQTLQRDQPGIALGEGGGHEARLEGIGPFPVAAHKQPCLFQPGGALEQQRRPFRQAQQVAGLVQDPAHVIDPGGG